ncbi:unnamed protein product [Ophioblennius macclurei]
MDLPSVPWQDHVAQKWISLDPDFREKFSSLEEIDEIFKRALSVTTQTDADVLQSVSAASSSSTKKDSDRAAECREHGNSSFKRRDYAAAALHYSQGVCFAPQTSEQLSLCYANRSAALYRLQLYQDCLDDVHRALDSGYPSHLAHKLQERRAACLRELPKGEKAAAANKEEVCGPEGPEGVRSPPAFLCPQAVVSSNVEKGRHLVAAGGIAAGEVILRETPFTCVLLPGLQEVKGGGATREVGEEFGTESRRCHRCLAVTASPVPCGGACSYSRYCSTRCRAAAWAEHHRWECPLGAELTATGALLQLALRTALKAGGNAVREVRGQRSDGDGDGDAYRSVFGLLHHARRHSPALRFLCAVSVAAVCLRLREAGPIPRSWSLEEEEEEGGDAAWSSEQWLLGSTVLRHMLQLRCNAQAVVAVQDSGAADASVRSSREVRLATAVFPTLSLLNHSCRPNTSLAFHTGTCDSSEAFEDDEGSSRGVVVTVRASKAVKPGEEILHCYGPHSSRMATSERRRLLQEQYFFLCQCEACSLQEEDKEAELKGRGSALLCCRCQGALKRIRDDGGSALVCSRSSCARRTSASEVKTRLSEVRRGLEGAVELLERERPGEALKLLERTRRQSEVVLAETHPLRGELEDATARAYATMGDWSNAASHLERSVAAISSQYGEDSVELAQQLFKLAQLHFNGAARGPALSVIPKVRRLLRLHRGPRCPELEELKDMEECLRGPP